MARRDPSSFALSDAAMSTVRRSLVAILILATSSLGQTLKKIATIDLPGPKGQRFDYLTIDHEDQFLLSAHLGPGILYVIDMRTNKLVKAVPGVPGITGLEFVRETRQVYTSDWGEEKIGIVDMHSMTVVKRLPTAAKPNGSTYAPPFRKVYVSDTLGKAVAVADVSKEEIVKTIEFTSQTGMPQYNSSARKVYVNLRNANEVAEIQVGALAEKASIRQQTPWWGSIPWMAANLIMEWPLIRNIIAHAFSVLGTERLRSLRWTRTNRSPTFRRVPTL